MTGKAVKSLAVVLALTIGGAAAAQKTPPYWASISAGEAKMRTGPGRNYPATWVYKRRHLPVKVIETFPSWRKVQDPDGTTGWMLAALLSEDRSAMVSGGIRPLRATPSAGAKIVWRAEPGVVGRIRSCEAGWCDIEIDGRRGYIETIHLWGVEAGEAVD